MMVASTINKKNVLRFHGFPEAIRKETLSKPTYMRPERSGLESVQESFQLLVKLELLDSLSQFEAELKMKAERRGQLCALSRHHVLASCFQIFMTPSMLVEMRTLWSVLKDRSRTIPV